MHCDRCENEATVHELRVVNGKKVERHLCESCARDVGLAIPGGVNVPELIQQMVQGAAPSAPKATAPAVPAAPMVCPSCGLGFEEFRHGGQLGCEHCYRAFEAQLGPLLERWHEGGSHHVGKFPRRAATGKAPLGRGVGAQAVLGGAAEQAARLGALQKQLADAVAAEQYERAAAIRDEIRRLPGAGAALPTSGPGGNS